MSSRPYWLPLLVSGGLVCSLVLVRNFARPLAIDTSSLRSRTFAYVAPLHLLSTHASCHTSPNVMLSRGDGTLQRTDTAEYTAWVDIETARNDHAVRAHQSSVVTDWS